jgi:transcriptional regulator with XRE-family HTH domain
MAPKPLPRTRSPQEQLGYRVIGRLIASRRRRLGWSQRYLEDRAGIDQAVISRIENGKQFGIQWARFATLVGAMGGLVDEPHPRDLRDPPRSPTRPPIDLWQGGLTAFDAERLLELDRILGPDAVAERNEVLARGASGVDDDTAFDDDG